MKVVLYLSGTEENRVDKTAFLSQVAELEGTIRGGSSVIAPTLLLELPYAVESEYLFTEGAEQVYADNDGEDPVHIGDPLTLLKFNYAYIPQFHRYYFVREVVTAPQGLYYVSMVCDALMSFKGEFMGLTAMVARNQFEQDPLVADTLRPMRTEKDVETRLMSTDGSLVNVSFDVAISGIGSGDFVFTALGQKPEWMDSYEPAKLESDIPGLPDEIATRRFSNNSKYIQSFVLTYANMRDISTHLLGDDTKVGFVVSCVGLPFHINSASLGRDPYAHDLVIGDNRVPATPQGNLRAPFYLYGESSPYLVVADETFPELSTYRDTEPYSALEFYLPYYGGVALPYARVAGCRIIVYYSISMYTGEGSVNIYDVTNQTPLFSGVCRLGYQISFNTTNERENNNARQASTLNTLLGVIGGALAVVGGAGNPVMMAGGMLTAGKAIASAVNTEINLMPRANTNIPSTLVGTQSPQKVQLVFIRSVPSFSDTGADFDEYAKTKGLPLQQARVLSTLSGFTVVDSIHLEGLSATAGEITSIETSLRAGVIL